MKLSAPGLLFVASFFFFNVFFFVASFLKFDFLYLFLVALGLRLLCRGFF